MPPRPLATALNGERAMADDDSITMDDTTDRLVALIRCLLHATIEHDTNVALGIIRQYVDRALPGTTNDDLTAAFERIMAETACKKLTLN
jgi:hypothetical protein